MFLNHFTDYHSYLSERGEKKLFLRKQWVAGAVSGPFLVTKNIHTFYSFFMTNAHFRQKEQKRKT